MRSIQSVSVNMKSMLVLCAGDRLSFKEAATY